VKKILKAPKMQKVKFRYSFDKDFLIFYQRNKKNIWGRAISFLLGNRRSSFLCSHFITKVVWVYVFVYWCICVCVCFVCLCVFECPCVCALNYVWCVCMCMCELCAKGWFGLCLNLLKCETGFSS